MKAVLHHGEEQAYLVGGNLLFDCDTLYLCCASLLSIGIDVGLNRGF